MSESDEREFSDVDRADEPDVEAHYHEPDRADADEPDVEGHLHTVERADDADEERQVHEAE